MTDLSDFTALRREWSALRALTGQLRWVRTPHGRMLVPEFELAAFFRAASVYPRVGASLAVVEWRGSVLDVEYTRSEETRSRRAELLLGVVADLAPEDTERLFALSQGERWTVVESDFRFNDERAQDLQRAFWSVVWGDSESVEISKFRRFTD